MASNSLHDIWYAYMPSRKTFATNSLKETFVWDVSFHHQIVDTNIEHPSIINNIFFLFCFTGAVTIPLENLNPSYEMVNWHQLTNFSRMTWEKWLKWWITLWYTALWHKYSIYIFFFTSFVHTILTNTFIYSIERIKKWYF